MIKSRLRNLRHVFGAPLAVRPGHFYSPICDPAEIKRYYHDPRQNFPETIDGINLNGAVQRELWESWSQYIRAFPFPANRGDFRYYSNNNHFGVGDATTLYCMLRHFRPKRLIEIGSGFSSACALDTIEHYLGNDVACTFIEPNPKLLYSRLNPSDLNRHTIIASPIQEVPLDTFDRLESGDFLFIDSTHVMKTASDVTFELFNILPRLKAGVFVHFHDIFYPFEYPRWFVDANYSWNEIYALRAFLTDNAKFEIVFFNDFFAWFAKDVVMRDAPRMLGNDGGNAGGSLWLRKT